MTDLKILPVGILALLCAPCGPALFAAAFLEQTNLWAADKDGYHTYRIPALLVTAKGSVLAFCEGRKTGSGDHGDLDLLMKRSTDDAPAAPREPLIATYSIVAFDPTSGDLGVAVQSKYFGVGSVVPWARAGVGAIATQASANVRYGPEGLRLLAEGKDAGETVRRLTEADERQAIRQLGIVDARGNTFAHTGSECLAWAGHIVGTNFTVQGNILAGEGVVKAMAEAYEAARKMEGSQLADWLTAALQAGEDAGGDSRGRQSAALLVVREGAGPNGINDRFIDLRVEDHPDPTKELSRLLEMHKQFHAGKHRNRPIRPPQSLAK